MVFKSKNSNKGAAVVEMAAIIGTISVVAIASIWFVGKEVDYIYCKAASMLSIDDLEGCEGKPVGGNLDETIAPPEAPPEEYADFKFSTKFKHVVYEYGTVGPQLHLEDLVGVNDIDGPMIFHKIRNPMHFSLCYQLTPQSEEVCAKPIDMEVEIPKDVYAIGYEITNLPDDIEDPYGQFIEFGLKPKAEQSKVFTFGKVAQSRQLPNARYSLTSPFADHTIAIGKTEMETVMLPFTYTGSDIVFEFKKDDPSLKFDICTMEPPAKPGQKMVTECFPYDSEIVITHETVMVGYRLRNLPHNPNAAYEQNVVFNISPISYFSSNGNVNIVAKRPVPEVELPVPPAPPKSPPGTHPDKPWRPEDQPGTPSEPVPGFNWKVTSSFVDQTFPIGNVADRDYVVPFTHETSEGKLVRAELKKVVPSAQYSLCVQDTVSAALRCEEASAMQIALNGGEYAVGVRFTDFPVETTTPYTAPVKLLITGYGEAEGQVQANGVNFIGSRTIPANVFKLVQRLANYEMPVGTTTDDAASLYMIPFEYTSSHTEDTIRLLARGTAGTEVCYRQTPTSMLHCSAVTLNVPHDAALIGVRPLQSSHEKALPRASGAPWGGTAEVIAIGKANIQDVMSFQFGRKQAAPYTRVIWDIDPLVPRFPIGTMQDEVTDAQKKFLAPFRIETNQADVVEITLPNAGCYDNGSLSTCEVTEKTISGVVTDGVFELKGLGMEQRLPLPEDTTAIWSQTGLFEFKAGEWSDQKAITMERLTLQVRLIFDKPSYDVASITGAPREHMRLNMQVDVEEGTDPATLTGNVSFTGSPIVVCVEFVTCSSNIPIEKLLDDAVLKTVYANSNSAFTNEPVTVLASYEGSPAGEFIVNLNKKAVDFGGLSVQDTTRFAIGQPGETVALTAVPSNTSAIGAVEYYKLEAAHRTLGEGTMKLCATVRRQGSGGSVYNNDTCSPAANNAIPLGGTDSNYKYSSTNIKATYQTGTTDKVGEIFDTIMYTKTASGNNTAARQAVETFHVYRPKHPESITHNFTGGDIELESGKSISKSGEYHSLGLVTVAANSGSGIWIGTENLPSNYQLCRSTSLICAGNTDPQGLNIGVGTTEVSLKILSEPGIDVAIDEDLHLAVRGKYEWKEEGIPLRIRRDATPNDFRMTWNSGKTSFAAMDTLQTVQSEQRDYIAIPVEAFTTLKGAIELEVAGLPESLALCKASGGADPECYASGVNKVDLDLSVTELGLKVLSLPAEVDVGFSHDVIFKASLGGRTLSITHVVEKVSEAANIDADFRPADFTMAKDQLFGSLAVADRTIMADFRSGSNLIGTVRFSQAAAGVAPNTWQLCYKYVDGAITCGISTLTLEASRLEQIGYRVTGVNSKLTDPLSFQVRMNLQSLTATPNFTRNMIATVSRVAGEPRFEMAATPENLNIPEGNFNIASTDNTVMFEAKINSNISGGGKLSIEGQYTNASVGSCIQLVAGGAITCSGHGLAVDASDMPYAVGYRLYSSSAANYDAMPLDAAMKLKFVVNEFPSFNWEGDASIMRPAAAPYFNVTYAEPVKVIPAGMKGTEFLNNDSYRAMGNINVDTNMHPSFELFSGDASDTGWRFCYTTAATNGTLTTTCQSSWSNLLRLASTNVRSVGILPGSSFFGAVDNIFADQERVVTLKIRPAGNEDFVPREVNVTIKRAKISPAPSFSALPDYTYPEESLVTTSQLMRVFSTKSSANYTVEKGGDPADWDKWHLCYRGRGSTIVYCDDRSTLNIVLAKGPYDVWLGYKSLVNGSNLLEEVNFDMELKITSNEPLAAEQAVVYLRSNIFRPAAAPLFSIDANVANRSVPAGTTYEGVKALNIQPFMSVLNHSSNLSNGALMIRKVGSEADKLRYQFCYRVSLINTALQCDPNTSHEFSKVPTLWQVGYQLVESEYPTDATEEIDLDLVFEFYAPSHPELKEIRTWNFYRPPATPIFFLNLEQSMISIPASKTLAEMQADGSDTHIYRIDFESNMGNRLRVKKTGLPDDGRYDICYKLTQSGQPVCSEEEILLPVNTWGAGIRIKDGSGTDMSGRLRLEVNDAYGEAFDFDVYRY